MRSFWTLLVLASLAAAAASAAAASPGSGEVRRREGQRIVGGSVTNIDVYPFTANMQQGLLGLLWFQVCGGIVINTISLLSAASCYYGGLLSAFRAVLGTSYASGSGGTVHPIDRMIPHPLFSISTMDNNIVIVRLVTPATYTSTVQPAMLAGANYNLPDNAVVWTIGWGRTSEGGSGSEQLLQVATLPTVNQNTCITSYAAVGRTITDNMLCSGWLDVDGGDACQGDSGGPLIHNGVVVGVVSWGQGCALARYSGVSARVSRYTVWIQNNS